MRSRATLSLAAALALAAALTACTGSGGGISGEYTGSVPPTIASNNAPTFKLRCVLQPASATCTPPEAHASPQCI